MQPLMSAPSMAHGQTRVCWGPQGNSNSMLKPKRQFKEGKSLEMCPTSLIPDETMQMLNYGTRDEEAQGLGGDTLTLSWGKRDHLMLIWGRGGSTGSSDLQHSLGEHASHPQSRSKLAAFTPGHKFSCTPHHQHQMSVEEKENRSLQMPVQNFLKHITNKTTYCPVKTLWNIQFPVPCAHAYC